VLLLGAWHMLLLLLLLLLLLCVAEDVYVHAELHGASSTIIRNHDPSRPVPPLTLQQAGCACVCRSKAWDAKLVTSAWWVHHHQVRNDVLLGVGVGVGGESWCDSTHYEG
jgi:hypothetical protein